MYIVHRCVSLKTIHNKVIHSYISKNPPNYRQINQTYSVNIYLWTSFLKNHMYIVHRCDSLLTLFPEKIHRRISYRPSRLGPTLYLKNEKNKTFKLAIKIEGVGWCGSVALSDPLKIVEHKSIRMHHLASLLSTFSLQVKKSYQIPQWCML